MTDYTVALIVTVILLPPALFGVLVAVETWTDIRNAFRDAKRDAGPIRSRRTHRDDLETRRQAHQ